MPSALRAAELPRRIPIGFLGATYSHGPDKIKLAMSSPDWDFVGVCDESPTVRQTCLKLGAKLISQDERFQRAQVVAVESEVRDHAAHALLALKAGKHVHPKELAAAVREEGPLTATLEEELLVAETVLQVSDMR